MKDDIFALHFQSFVERSGGNFAIKRQKMGPLLAHENAAKSIIIIIHAFLSYASWVKVVGHLPKCCGYVSLCLPRALFRVSIQLEIGAPISLF